MQPGAPELQDLDVCLIGSFVDLLLLDKHLAWLTHRIAEPGRFVLGAKPPYLPGLL